MNRTTPRPWRLCKDANGRCLITTDAGVPIAQVFLEAGDLPREQLEANASLIRMAPKLLEVCRRAKHGEPDESLLETTLEEASISLETYLLNGG